LGPYLEIAVDVVEAFRVLRQLRTNIFRVDEDALQVRPGALHLQPDANHLVSGGQLLLPNSHLVQKVIDVLGRKHVLQLNLQTWCEPMFLKKQAPENVIGLSINNYDLCFLLLSEVQAKTRPPSPKAVLMSAKFIGTRYTSVAHYCYTPAAGYLCLDDL